MWVSNKEYNELYDRMIFWKNIAAEQKEIIEEYNKMAIKLLKDNK